MNESDFEKELRALRPAAPPALVEQRIAAALAGQSHRAHTSGMLAPSPRESLAARFFRGFGWACAGAAAAIAAVAWLHELSKTTRPPASGPVQMVEADRFEPAGSERELLDTADDGVLLQADAEPVRQVRYSYVERHAWRSPTTGARVEIEVPREDIYLMPVAMQ